MRYNQGWIKVYRRTVDEDIGTNANLLALWVTLLLWATRWETKIIRNGIVKILPPGTVVVGMRALASQLGLSKDTVYRWLQYLKQRETITLTSDTRGTLITICNFKEYQLYDSPPRDTGETRKRHGRDSNGEVKNKELKTCPTTALLEELYKSYPKRDGNQRKGEAIKRLGKLVDQNRLEDVTRAIQNYKAHCVRRNIVGTAYVQMAATFFNGTWEEWISTPARPEDALTSEQLIERGFKLPDA